MATEEKGVAAAFPGLLLGSMHYAHVSGSLYGVGGHGKSLRQSILSDSQLSLPTCVCGQRTPLWHSSFFSRRRLFGNVVVATILYSTGVDNVLAFPNW